MRERYLDSSGGILLIHMILWHCSQFAGVAMDYQMATAVFACFMPWFFYKGGIFYSRKPLRTMAINSGKRLLVPFAYFTILGIALDLMRFCILDAQPIVKVLNNEVHTLVVSGAVPGNLALWFLTTLFAVRIIYATCDSFSRWLKYTILFIICSVPFGVYTIWDSMPSWMPLWVVNIPIGLFFYSMGTLLCPHTNRNITSLILIISYVAIMIFWPTIGDARDGVINTGSRWAWYPLALMGIWSINTMCHMLLNNTNPLSFIGRNTMPIYCWHWPLMVVTQLLIPADITGWSRFAILAISCLMVLPFTTVSISKQNSKNKG